MKWKYEKFEVFDLQITLTSTFEMILTLVNCHCIIKVFDLLKTLTLVKTSQQGVITKLVVMNNLRYLTLK